MSKQDPGHLDVVLNGSPLQRGVADRCARRRAIRSAGEKPFHDLGMPGDGGLQERGSPGTLAPFFDVVAGVDPRRQRVEIAAFGCLAETMIRVHEDPCSDGWT
nr:hypothetical protein [Rhodococcus maanshanensis]